MRLFYLFIATLFLSLPAHAQRSGWRINAGTSTSSIYCDNRRYQFGKYWNGAAVSAEWESNRDHWFELAFELGLRYDNYKVNVYSGGHGAGCSLHGQNKALLGYVAPKVVFSPFSFLHLELGGAAFARIADFSEDKASCFMLTVLPDGSYFSVISESPSHMKDYVKPVFLQPFAGIGFQYRHWSLMGRLELFSTTVISENCVIHLASAQVMLGYRI